MLKHLNIPDNLNDDRSIISAKFSPRGFVIMDQMRKVAV